MGILVQQGFFSRQHPHWSLTATGFSRLEAIDTSVNSRDAFVAMWFAPDLEVPFKEGIAPAIEACGFRATRVDRVENNNKIDDEIVAGIRRSRFLIADATCGFSSGPNLEPLPRGGVYWEAGFAYGLGLPVIWCVREDCLAHVHFDTRQFSHIVWKDAADLRQRLVARIRATIDGAE